MYENRNGVIEQVRYFRQQPEHMKHAPFDFEADEAWRKAALMDMAVFITCALTLIALFVWVYL